MASNNGVIFDALQAAQQKTANDAADVAAQRPNTSSLNMGVATGNSDYNGINLPGYTSLYDPNSAYAQLANRTGPSPYAMLATSQQNQIANNAKENSAVQANAQEAQADDNLAMQGGLTSGARERSAQEGAKNYLSMAQNADRQSNLNNMQIGINDEQNRISMLGTDNQNQINDKQAQSQYNQWLSGQQNQAVAANEQAKATQNTGGGSFICTELLKRRVMTVAEYRKLHKVGVGSVLRRADFIAWYLDHAPKAVSMSKDIDLHSWHKLFVQDVLRAKTKEERETEYIIAAKLFVQAFTGEDMPVELLHQSWIRSLKALPKVLTSPHVKNYIKAGFKERLKLPETQVFAWK